MAFDIMALLNMILGAGEVAGGVASGNPMLGIQGAGQLASGGSAMIGGQPGSGNIAGPPSPGMMGQLGSLGQGLGQLGPFLSQNSGGLGSILGQGNQFKPLPPLAKPGPPTPFQSTPTTGAGGANPILDLLKKLLGGMQ